MILTTFQEIKLYNRKLIRDGEKEILKKLPGKKVEVTVLSPEERKRWADATAGVYKEFDEQIGKDLIKKAEATIAGK